MRKRVENNYDVRLTSINHKINRKAMILADAEVSLSRGEHKEEVFNNFFFETLAAQVGETVSRYPESAEEAPFWVL